MTMLLTLDSDAQTQCKHSTAKVLKQIRKAEKSVLTVQIGGKERLADFSAIFAQNLRDLGTPVYGCVFF